MAVSIREQILSAIATAVGGEYGLETPENERDLPATIVQDGEDIAEENVYNQTAIQMPVVVATIAESETSDPNSLRAQANALLAAISPLMYADETFGGLADRIEYTGGGIEAEVGKFVFAVAQFTVHYHTVRGDPLTID